MISHPQLMNALLAANIEFKMSWRMSYVLSEMANLAGVNEQSQVWRGKKASMCALDNLLSALQDEFILISMIYIYQKLFGKAIV